jgi:hypothetical protein
MPRHRFTGTGEQILETLLVVLLALHIRNPIPVANFTRFQVVILLVYHIDIR